jgi:hypothetical protein
MKTVAVAMQKGGSGKTISQTATEVLLCLFQCRPPGYQAKRSGKLAIYET